MTDRLSQQPKSKSARRSRSRYGVQLKEKQNLKHIFGIREEQLRRYYNNARRRRSATGQTLVELLESRLDNAVYRAGLAQTRAQARQMVSHRLLLVNDRPVNIPSYRLKKGDVVSVKPSKRKKSYFSNYAKRMQGAQPPSWITLDTDNYAFTVAGNPTMEEAALAVDITAVVELFAR